MTDKMGSLFVVENSEGRIQFQGTKRGWDESTLDAFSVELSNQQLTSGEWRPVFKSNGNDFDIEIVSCGYRVIDNLGNPNRYARRTFTQEEIEKVKRLIYLLLENRETFENITPFTLKKGSFQGSISFAKDWVLFAPP